MGDDRFERLIDLISARTGLRASTQDNRVLRKIVADRMAFHRFSSIQEYTDLLSSDTDENGFEREELTFLLTVGESYFFRDKGQFQLIRERILPELAERRKAERTIRIWSAGCSTGEEPYTLAIILSEMMSDFAGWKVTVIGTDIKEEFLKKAKRGIFGTWSFRTVPEEIRTKYFREYNGLFKLDPLIKNMVTFQRGDLVKDAFPDSAGALRDMDLILCRNVFIYYERKAVSAIVEKMAGTLREGGYLIVGHGELFSATTNMLTPRMFPQSMAYERVKEGSTPSQELFRPTYFAPALSAQLAPAPAINPPHVVSAIKKADWQSVLFAAGECFNDGNYRGAIDHLNKFPKEIKGDFRSLILMASSHANLGEYTRSVGYLHKAIAVNRFSAEPYYLLSHIAEENGQLDDAKENLRKVIYLEPSAVTAYLELAAIHENEGDFEKARKMRTSALAALKKLPKDEIVGFYKESAENMIKFVEKMLE